MRDLVRRIRDQLAVAPDTICLERARLATEAWAEHEHEPAPLRRAYAFRHILRHMTLDLHSNPVFAGNTSSRPRAWMLLPEYGIGTDAQVMLENVGLEGILEGAVPHEITAFWEGRSFGGLSGIGHLAVDMEAVVHRGLLSLAEEIARFHDEGDEDQRAYRDAMRISLEAVVEWAGRYAEAARARARREPDPLHRRCLERVASACAHVPANPARDLFEALQAIALVHLAVCVEGHGMSVSVGLPDRVLARFVGPETDTDETTALLGAFMLKLTANSLHGRGSKTQAITVGGMDHRGRDCCNALTLRFLDACDLVRVGDPHLFLRWHPDMDDHVKRRAAELLASGLSMPLLVGDMPTAQGFMNAGVAPRDAWEYCVIGCNELGIPGRSADSATATAGQVAYVALLNEALESMENPDEMADMAPLLARVEGLMEARLEAMRQRGAAHRERTAREAPTPFTSALMRNAIRRGRDMAVGMDYHLQGIYERGLTNAANALAAIHEVVFERREARLSEIVAALRDSFPDERLRARLQAAPKWGNDDPRADRWALTLAEMRERVLDRVDARHGGAPHMSCHVVRSLHHLDGARLGASADGRRAGAPLADSIGAHMGTARTGPTGVLRSVLKLDAARTYRGGYNLNLTLPGGRASTEEVLGLVEAFFVKGGQELQVSCLDPARLREARDNPAAHRDLVVRVAGFSARFVDLSPLEQEELIARACAADGSGAA